MADPESDPSVSVSTGEVRVGKAFEADRFPVPAIAFEIESLADDPIRIRLVDQIPESFSMEGVGFHPDYDSDNWTAYRDHRVAYERTLDPRESILTVYGIRIDDPSEADAFLGEPTIELIETDAAPDTGDVLGRETTQVVRDALSGEGGNGLSDLGSDPDSDSDSEPLLGDADTADSDADETEPREMADDLDAAIRDRDADVTRVDAADTTEDEEAEDAQETVPSAAAAEALDPRSGDGADAVDAVTDDADDAAASEAESEAEPSQSVEAESVAAALAAEVRAGRVDDDDLAVLREAFEAEVPTSVDARIGRLQSQVEDLLGYSDALADFLDENGTAEEVISEVHEEVSDLNDRVADLEDSLSAAEADRAELGDEVASVADDVEAVSDRVDDLAALDETVERLDERLAAVESFEDDIEEIRAELDELRTFRDRLNNAFGTAEE